MVSPRWPGVSCVRGSLVSIPLTPTMSARLLRGRHGAGAAPASRAGFYGLVEKSYMAILGFAMRWRVLVALLALATIASSWPLYGRVKQEYTPTDVDEAEFEVNVNGPEGASVLSMDAAMREVEDLARATPGVRLVLATTGGSFIGQVASGSLYV